MKFPYIAAALTLSLTALSGCSSTGGGKSPAEAIHTSQHEGYWRYDKSISVAKNAYSLAGVTTNVSDVSGVDEGAVSKYLIAGSAGYITGGLKGLGIMSAASLYSSDDAEWLPFVQFVLFVPNKPGVAWNDDSVVKAGAKVVFSHLYDKSKAMGLDNKAQMEGLENCQLDKAVMNLWSKCVSPTPKAGMSFDAGYMYGYQIIRKATGRELPQLNLPQGDYTIIRYSNLPARMKDGVDYGALPNGFVMMPYSEKLAPVTPSITLNNKSYYFYSGQLGNTPYPLRTPTGK